MALLLVLSVISAIRAEYVISNAAATLTFAAPGGGLACCGIGAPGAPAFVSNGNPAAPGLWP